MVRLNPSKTMAELVYPRLLPASRPSPPSPISKIPTFNPTLNGLACQLAKILAARVISICTRIREEERGEDFEGA